MQLKPLRGWVVKHLDLICALLWLAIMANICDKVIFGLWIRRLAIWVYIIPQIKALQREGYNCWIFFNEEIVVAKSFYNEHNIGWNATQTISPNLPRFTTL